MTDEKEYVKDLGSVAEASPVEMRDGIVRRTLVFSDRMLMSHWRIKAGVQFGEHSHPFEQAGFVVQGRLRIVIDGRPTDLHAGSAYLVPMNVRHDAIALEDVEVIDIFSPLREEYID